VGGGKPKDGPVVFQSVVLRLEVKGPGEGNNPERVHERVLVTSEPADLPFVRVSILVDNAVLRPGERERSALRALAASKPAYDVLVASLAGGKGDASQQLGEPREPMGMLMAFADLRRQVQARVMGGSGQHLRERTGIIAVFDHARLSGPAKDTLVIERRFDLVANPVAFVGRDGTLDAATAVALGVADTALEAALMGPDTDAARGGTAWHHLQKTSGIAKVEKKRGVLEVAWSDAAWWSVDPRSGTTVGRVPGGGGQAMYEYAFHATRTACNWGWMISFASAGQRKNPYHIKDVDKWAGRICAAVAGTLGPQLVMEHIDGIKGALWDIAIPALRGVPHEE
jgi:hypothetical protein